MVRATWNGVVLAETDRPVLLEGNACFPAKDVRREYLAKTRAWSVCPWKGLARYFTVRAAGRVNKNAAWYYPRPSPLARKIKDHVAFWNGVQVDAAMASPGPAVAAARAVPQPEPGPVPDSRQGGAGR
jgi:uncharacterized protein (DUF427 family)